MSNDQPRGIARHREKRAAASRHRFTPLDAAWVSGGELGAIEARLAIMCRRRTKRT